jgi:hypothetical protein
MKHAIALYVFCLCFSVLMCGVDAFRVVTPEFSMSLRMLLRNIGGGVVICRGVQ